MNVAALNRKYSMDDLIEIMHRLRAPDGCPWDNCQTHKSIRRDFLEECYEAIEAIDEDSPEMLREELGDVLFQVVFHSVIEEEKGVFDFADVVNEVSAKMVLRHPHVFGEVHVNNEDELWTNWDNIKKETKGQTSDKEMLSSITKAMPALMRAQKIVKKAGKLGAKVSEDTEKELSELAAQGDFTEEKLGKMLLLMCSVAQENGLDAEKSLTDAANAFIDENF